MIWTFLRDGQRRDVSVTPRLRGAAVDQILAEHVMIRIAEEFARRDKCWALVTGDSLGQVASQTPENLGVVEEAAQLPVLRPLIGMDKTEITDQAQRIGTDRLVHLAFFQWLGPADLDHLVGWREWLAPTTRRQRATVVAWTGSEL